MNSPIEITELTDKPMESFLTMRLPVDLGKDNPYNQSVNYLVDKMIQGAKSKGGRVFRLKWQGDRVPSGAQLGPFTITWTQHGMVTAEDGSGEPITLGLYERIVDEYPEQEMVVTVWPEKAKLIPRTNPGCSCRRNPASMHQDFLGNPLNVGDFVAYAGGGNSKAEYGLILHKIIALKPDGAIQTERLTVRYPDHKTPVISRGRSNIKSLTKVVLVKPSMAVQTIFDDGENYPEIVAGWIHGTKLVDWTI